MLELSAEPFAVESLRQHVTPAEWAARIDLAGCYRLVAQYGMADMAANHVSLAVPGEHDGQGGGAFLINAYGMLYEEITASSLHKIDLDGNVLLEARFRGLPDGIKYGVNRAGFVIHAAIHRARPEYTCVIHTHTWAGMAVSSLECGLLPLNQTSMRFAKIGYHDYQGVALDLAEQESLLADLGDANALILRNHGLLTVGRSIGEAFNAMHRLELSCRAQLAALACNAKLNRVPAEIVEATWNNYQPGTRRPYGVLEWPALLRQMDRLDPGYRS
jgi:ribulose-5-phosphate 4-epimerase/fuculose-1-phosphate aldolase